MLVLAVETGTERASAVLAEDGAELAAWREVTHQDLCRRLAPEVRAVLRGAARGFDDVELVGVGLGPGAFTALRVGLATTKAIAMAREIPLVGISSLGAMCWQVRGQVSGLVCPVLDARRGEVYAAIYRVTEDTVEQLAAEFAARPEELARRLRRAGGAATVFGELDRIPGEDIAQALGDAGTVWSQRTVLPDALAVAQLASRRYASSGADDPASLRPIYVRKSYAEERFDIDLGLR